MLEIRTNCECCHKVLPANSTEAMICGFECTFCRTCVDDKLQNVCPNCGGGFEKRPVRPKAELVKYPVKSNLPIKPFKEQQHKGYLKQYLNVKPEER